MSKKGSVKEFLVRMFKTPSFYFCLLFVILNLFFTKKVLDGNGRGEFWVVAAIEVVVEFGAIATLYYMRKKNKPLEKQFLLVAVILGVLFILLLPPGQSPDEESHFRRAYGIADGVLVPGVIDEEKGAVGSSLPASVGVDFKEISESGSYGEVINKLDDGVTEYTEQGYNNSALYNFICYIPQAVAILIGKILGFSVLGMAYLARIFNFVVWILLVYFAIKVTPKFKGIVAFIALLPITLQEATSLSPDALTIGLGIFLVSYVLYLAYGEKSKIEKKELAILSGIALVIGFCKIVYLPLLLLYVLIPYKKFGSKKKKWIFLGILGAIVAILNLAWLAVSSGFLVEFNPGVDSKEQLARIIGNPFNYGGVMLNTISENVTFWLMGTVGVLLGAFDFNLPMLYFYVSFGLLVVLFAQRNEILKIKMQERLLFAGVFLVIFVLICTSLYLQWTPVGATVVEGIQGRYFIPILLLVPIIFCRSEGKKPNLNLVSNNMVLHYSIFLGVLACVTFFAQNI